ncbi:MAG: extracellular solute-binding protein [Chloroflexi bacterium]|nr:extracellular solute-binding protein [Chloroflexota bacterium]
MNRKLGAVIAVLMVVVVGCGGTTSSPGSSASASASGSGGLAAAELTLWHNYGTEANAVATQNLVKAFEAKYPQIKINVVSQPADNYFDLLQAAAIPKTGPDIAVQWTGLFDLKYKDYLEPLNSYIPVDELKKLKGIEYSSLNFNPDDGVLVVPLEVQFYNGFYNKELFTQAGLDPDKFPTTWDELFDACTKLKAKNITPFVYGTGGQALGGGFYPWYDFSYLMMIYSPEDWKKLYTGETSWTDPAILDQVSKWASLFTKGCTNQDVLTNQDSVAQFIAGDAAMTMEGTWSIAQFQQEMGDKVDVFVPPFSPEPVKGVVEYGGDGFSMTTYSQHKEQAAAFLAFLASDEAQPIVAAAGLIPAKDGFSTDERMAKKLLSFAAEQSFTRYPMIDNVIQPEVSDAGTQVLNAAFGGSMSVEDAMKNMHDTLMELPDDRRGNSYQ